VLPEGGDFVGAGTADEGESEIAAGGHDLGGRTAAQVGAILAEGQVAQPVTTLDAPVPAYKREQAVRVRVAGGEAGNEIVSYRLS
jgi:thioesterase domain-containing protein